MLDFTTQEKEENYYYKICKPKYMIIIPNVEVHSDWLARYDTRMQMDSTDPRVTDQHNYPKIVVMIEYNCTLLKGQLHYMTSKTLAVINIIFVSLYGRRLLQNIAILY